MKLKDIKVGEEYAVGTQKYNHRGTAVEVGIRGRVMHGYHMADSEKADYVRLSRDGRPDSVVPCRQVIRLWSEQAPINAAKKAESDARFAERKRVKRLHEAAEDLLEAAKSIIADWDITGAPRPGTRTHPLRAAVARAEDAS